MPTPIIDKSKCVDCGDCIEICPMECFENKDGDVIVCAPDTCIGCKACEVQCPHEAIIVED
jgi:NAD-dependent dihydropyrimidine dehydrogenase PreA subunit